TQGYLIRKLMPKYGEKRVLAIGLTLSALGYALCGMSEARRWVLTIGVTALGFGNGMATPSLNGSISLASAADAQGNNLGVSQSLSSLARIIGPPLGGGFYEQIGVWSPFLFSAVAVGCGCLVTVFRG